MAMVMPDLKSEAAAEATRLARARELTQDGDDDTVARLEGDPAWVAHARGWRARKALGSRLVLLWRVALEDMAGTTVESRLVAVALNLPGEGLRCVSRKRLEVMVRHLEPAIRAELAPVTAAWQQDADGAVRSFLAARTSRCHAIAARIAETPVREFQPGLFDRRAERERERTARRDGEARAIATDERLGSNSIAAISLRPAQLLLVLAP